MSKAKKKTRASLEEILASTSDNLFPAEMGVRKISVDTTDCDGDTPLHVMVWRKDRYAVNLLIESGADINAVGDMGQTPLHVAVSQEDLHITEALLKANAKINIRSEFNETASEKAEKIGGEMSRLFKKHAPT